MLEYPVVLERDLDGRVVATCPDVTGASGVGEYDDDALARARAALLEALGVRIRTRRPIPEPSDRGRALRVRVPPLVEAKLHVYREMWRLGLTRVELARRLGWHRPQVDRLLDLTHASRLEQLDAALAVLGLRLDLVVEDLEGRTSRPRGSVR
ncbi:MAG: type II toxin-antitoxin system HicB family antitoxin [Acidimicrobiia bacterium]|nr:type II toxin-antitoxin system HicB family antitoxin [Acidimicrobiia bacterium]